MKTNRLSLTIALLLIFAAGLAQEFAPIGAEWFYSASGMGAAPTGSEYYHYKSVKDTLIGEIELRKIEGTWYRYRGDTITVPPYFIYQSGDTVSLYDPEPGIFYRLFVFNLSQGDTLLMDIPFPSDFMVDTTYRVIVDTVINEIVDGNELTKYVFEQPDEFGWFTGFYYNKIGGYEWFTPLGKAIIPEENGPIRCYHDAETDINFTSNACNYRIINSLEPDRAGSVMIYPNPTTGKIYLKTDIVPDRIEVYDQAGRLVMTGSHSLLNLEKLENGSYLVSLHFGEIISRQTIIKH